MLTTPKEDGSLGAQDVLTLQGVKHLIGSPWRGKRPFLSACLGIWHVAALRRLYSSFIEVCRRYLEDLHLYDVKAGLLVGQSPETRRIHATKLAEALATEDELRGFARTTLAANLFEGACALPALTDAPEQAKYHRQWFCRSVLQKSEHKGRDEEDRYRACLCPAWSVCSANRAARELPDAPKRLGHIRSAGHPSAIAYYGQ